MNKFASEHPFSHFVFVNTTRNVSYDCLFPVWQTNMILEQHFDLYLVGEIAKKMPIKYNGTLYDYFYMDEKGNYNARDAFFEDEWSAKFAGLENAKVKSIREIIYEGF
jgi:hypothetical protein